MPYLIDTTILIDALRGVPGVVDRLRSLPLVPLVSAVSFAEIYRGMRDSERRLTEEMLAWVRVAPLTGDAGRIAGLWQREYRAQGITLALSDTLIAATAFTHRAVLATGNPRHFPMPEVHVEHWPSDGPPPGPAAG